MNARPHRPTALSPAAAGVFCVFALAAPAPGQALLAPGSGQAPTVAEASDILPIPAEPTPEQARAVQQVIDEARENDVAAEEGAVLYHGLQLLQDEEYEEAIPFLEEALRRDPSMQSGWEGLGWAYIKTGEVPRAKRLWEYFRRLMPQETLPHSLLAQASIIDRDWIAADGHFRDAIATGGASFDVRFWYAQNLMRIGRADEAEKAMRVLVEEDPDRLDVQLDLASLLNQRLAYDEAVEIYRRVNEELPGMPLRMLEQALLETRVGELERADAICLDVLDIDPGNTQAMTLRADIAEIAGQHDIDLFLSIIDETPDPVVRAQLRVRLANRCHLANQLQPDQYEASFILDLVRKAIDEDPGNLEYKLLYAERLLQEGDTLGCRKWVVDVLENDNRHQARAKMFLFELALRERRFEDALQVLADRYGAFDPTDPMQHFYKSRLYVAQGDFLSALRELDQMEAAANQGCVLTLSYHGLTESDWTPSTSVRRLHEHIVSLQREGWTLVSPADLPELVGLAPGERRADPPAEPDVPATARFFDWIRWAVTGKRRFPSRVDGSAEAPRPKKYFAITFDDDQRSSLILGTGVAHDFGIPFALFTQTEPSDQYVPSRAGWQELREAAASGAWIVGSQLHSTYLKKPVDKEGKDVRPSLPNRIWIPEKNRRESMNEWDRRMRDEFLLSSRILAEEMGSNACPVAMVAYPYGDVGQDGACNLAAMRNPTQSILSEAARQYKVGFLPSTGGFTVAGDNLLMCRRWEPPWSAEGSDVVRHAYEWHPVFLARRARVQIAMLTNRPNLAGRMLDLLRRDGYPEALCRNMEHDIQIQFRNVRRHEMRPLLAVEGAPASDGAGSNAFAGDAKELALPGEPAWADGTSAARSPLVNKDDAPENDSVRTTSDTSASLTEITPDPAWEPGRPRLGATGRHVKANDQVEIVGYGLEAGIDINRNTFLDLRYSSDSLKQTVIPRWNAYSITNVPYADSKYKFKARVDEVAATLTRRTEGGALLHATVGVASRTPSDSNPRAPANLQDDINSGKFDPADDDNCVLVGLGARWHPRDNLELVVDYEHAYVLSAVKNIESDAAGVTARWLPEDGWRIETGARYASYEDDNAFFSARLESFWETNPDLGVWLGLELSTASTSDPCDYYWTPYWDQRIMGVLRYFQRWEGYGFRLDLLGGFTRSRGRDPRYFDVAEPEEKTVYVDGQAQTVVEQKIVKPPLEDEDTAWELAWGVDAQYEKNLGEHAQLLMTGTITALHEYIDHNFTIALRLHW